eukprot:Gb_29223 [translate_table: standard]
MGSEIVVGFFLEFEFQTIKCTSVTPLPAEETTTGKAHEKGTKCTKKKKPKAPKEPKEKKTRAPKGSKTASAHLSLSQDGDRGNFYPEGSQYAISEFKYKSILPSNFKNLLSVQVKSCAIKGKLTKVKASYKLSKQLKKPVKKPVVAKKPAPKKPETKPKTTTSK